LKEITESKGGWGGSEKIETEASS